MPADLSPPGIPPGSLAFPEHEPPPGTRAHDEMMAAREARREGIRKANGWPGPRSAEDIRRFWEREGLLCIAFPEFPPRLPKHTSSGKVDESRLEELVKQALDRDFPNEPGTKRMKASPKLVLPADHNFAALRDYARMLAARQRLTAHLPTDERPAAIARMKADVERERAEFIESCSHLWRKKRYRPHPYRRNP